MEKEEIYDFIGNLAIALYTQQIQISLSALNKILEDKGWSYGNNRGLAQGVAAAHRHWAAKDNVIHHAIAYTYRNRDGEVPWQQ